ncbi:Fic family protein [Avibacterium avium]|uniref:protein adenylyltransferase n=1 Tax=Avibacterium avium TaxID=751 RepID=A0A379ATA5_AVIAV|nr:Fic family protein [Avibacterium avium]SUB24323.1 Probable adenosine monophosphate-protein transferase fic [Avibacterium avium]
MDYILNFKDIKGNEERFKHYYIDGTNVLKNLLNLIDNDLLSRAEKYLVSVNYKKASLVKKSFDFEHVQSIHYSLFGDIYPFAGQLRQANMGKNITGETYYDQQKAMFMDYKEIPYHINFFNNYMISKSNLSGISDKEKFAKELCEVYLFINDIHAFREGNGRTQNEFIRQLAEYNGYVLDIQSAMNKYKEQGVNYYQWFYEYQKTGRKEEILKNLFIDNIKTKNEYKKTGKFQKN